MRTSVVVRSDRTVVGRGPLGLLGAAALAACLLLANGLCCGEADSIDSGIEKARRQYVQRLEWLAQWCEAERLHAYRDSVHRRILALEPDHARARFALGYRRSSRNAPWEDPVERRAASDWNKGLLPEADRRLAEAVGTYRTAALAILAAAGPDLSPGRREEAMEYLVDDIQDDAELRRARGDVQWGARWVLPETVSAYKRRQELIAMARAAVADAPAPVEDLPGRRAGWRFAWKLGLRTVYGTVDPQEGRRIARDGWAADRLLDALFPGARRPDGRLVLLKNEDEAHRMLEQDPNEAAALSHLPFAAGVYLKTGAGLAYWTDAWSQRLGSTRIFLDTRIPSGSGSRKRGWIIEGMGQRLCWYLLARHSQDLGEFGGTNRPPFSGHHSFLPNAAVDWLPESWLALSQGGPERFRALLTAQLNSLASLDVLMGYALASYLLEARPECVPTFLGACASQDEADKMTRPAFGVDAASLYWHLRRWVGETPRR